MINVKVIEPSGTIMLDRADRCNALGREMVSELQQAIEDLRQEKRVRGIVLTGTGPHFCSGLDAKELHESSNGEDAMQQWFADAQAVQSLFEQMLHCPKPLIAAVDGVAMGTGLGLVLACDMVVVSHRTKFSVPATKLGLVSGLVVPLLTFRAGASTASRILLGGDELSAKEAKELGLAHHVVDPEQVWVRARTWVDRIAESAEEAVQLTKKVLTEMVGEQLSTMLASGAAATATALTTEAAKEGLAAFHNKRPPNFP